VSDHERVSPVKRLFGGAAGVYGMVFSVFFIGISVVITGGSILCLPFVLGGVCVFGASAYGFVQAIRGRPNELEPGSARGTGPTTTAPRSPEVGRPPERLSCPRCAAPLRDDAEISPSGDVKCPHCRSWFNVRV
jgi:hypothetical protein